MTIDKETTEMIMEELKSAATEIFSRYGLDTPKIRGKYGSSVSFTLEATRLTRDESGVNTASVEAQYFSMFGHTTLSGVSLEAPLGTKFSSGGKDYIFAGIASKRRKYPIYCLHADTLNPVLFTDAVVSVINKAAAMEKAGA